VTAHCFASQSNHPVGVSGTLVSGQSIRVLLVVQCLSDLDNNAPDRRGYMCDIKMGIDFDIVTVNKANYYTPTRIVLTVFH